MSVKYFAILTNQGAAKLANATALGTRLNLTQLAIGDGNGSLPIPNAAQTRLINQTRIAPLNALSVDPENESQIVAEQIIPESEGGYWIRELGLFDDEGVLIAVANCPETYKPQLQEGSGRTQTIRMVVVVSSTAAVTLKIDPSVVLATRKYVDNAVIEVEAYADNLLKQHIDANNPHTQYAPIASPIFTGTPKAPTAGQISNDTQLANTAFVHAAIAALISGELTKKQPLDKTLTDLSGKNAAAILKYLGLGEAAKRNVGTGTSQIPDMASFSGVKDFYGKQSLPGGLLLQWLNIPSNAAANAVTLANGNYQLSGYKWPQSFTALFAVFATKVSGSTNEAYAVSVNRHPTDVVVTWNSHKADDIHILGVGIL